MQTLIRFSQVKKALFEVHARVQADIAPGDDMAVHGLSEYWTTVQGKGMGDCDDYAITKLRALVKRFPDHARAFRLATCCEGIDPAGLFIGYHLVLLVHTDQGVYVLDNLYPQPMAITAIKGRVWCFQEPAEAGGPWVYFQKPQGRDTILVYTPDRKVI